MKKIAFLFVSALFLSSCATTDTKNSFADESVQVQAEDENSAEENSEESAENSGDENSAESDETESENSAEEESPEEILEPIGSVEGYEDVLGYYESDPEPVFLSPADTHPEIPAEEEIPIEIAEEKSDEAENSPEISSENSAEEISAEKTENSAGTESENSAGTESENSAEKTETQTSEIPLQNEIPREEISAKENPPAKIVPPENEPPEKNSAEKNEEISAEKNENSAEEIQIVPSRTAEIKNNQYLDIVYPGKGWIYLGEPEGKNFMRYFGRKIGETDTTFSLRSRDEGETILHFYKNDPLTGSTIDDYLAVKISGTNDSQIRAAAPSYAEIVPPKPEKKSAGSAEKTEISPAKENPVQTESAAKNSAGNSAKTEEKKSAEKSVNIPAKTETKSAEKKAEIPSRPKIIESKTESYVQPSSAETDEKTKTAISLADDMDAAEVSALEEKIKNSSAEKNTDSTADELLKKAQESYDAKKFSDALSYLEEFFEKSNTRLDEALFLQGQIFESNSEVRNIRNALDNYETIVRRYPQSSKWNQANNRAIYLRKFYFNIR
jgi:hypothetical protein